MLHDQTIVCFGTLSWDFLWMRHQEIMARFARAGNLILYVEPIGIRVPKWEDRQRLVARVRNRQRAGPRGLREVMPNVWAIDPLVNPFQQIGMIHRRNLAALTRQVRAGLDSLGGGKPIIWTYVPTPLARDTIAAIPHTLVVYDCIDALTENPKGVFASFAESEKALSRAADLVLVTAPTLLERQRELNPQTYYVPHGVNYAEFASNSAPEPAALRPIPHPRLVFFGGIDERVDLDLLGDMAQSHPAWQIVLMGIVRTDMTALQKYPNVHYLGHIEHSGLPAFLHHSDVLLLPYRQIGFSHYMNPAKLPEILAVGKPTVATALPIFDGYRDVLRVAATPPEFAGLVAQAIQERDNATQIAARQTRARENTWDARFAEINALMEQQLAA